MKLLIKATPLRAFPFLLMLLPFFDAQAGSEVKYISASTEVTTVDGKTAKEATVTCRGKNGDVLITRKSSEKQWCGKLAEGFCGRTKMTAGLKVCHRRYRSALEAQAVLAQGAQKMPETSPQPTTVDVAAPVAASQVLPKQAPIVKSSSDELNEQKQQLSIEKERLNIERQRLELRKQQIELQKQELALKKQLEAATPKPEPVVKSVAKPTVTAAPTSAPAPKPVAQPKARVEPVQKTAVKKSVLGM